MKFTNSEIREINTAIDFLDKARIAVSSLAEELSQKLEDKSEKQQESEVGQEMQTAIENLEEIASSIEEVFDTLNGMAQE